MKKTFELLHLTKTLNESESTDNCLPTLKQLEELKFHVEQLKVAKVEQSNEVSESLLGHSSDLFSDQSAKEIPADAEQIVVASETDSRTSGGLLCASVDRETSADVWMQSERDKCQVQLDQCREMQVNVTENLERSHKEREKQRALIKSVEGHMKRIFGMKSIDDADSWVQLEREWKAIVMQIKQLEEQLKRKDIHTSELHGQIKEELVRLNADFDTRHQSWIDDREQRQMTHDRDMQQMLEQVKVK